MRAIPVGLLSATLWGLGAVHAPSGPLAVLSQADQSPGDPSPVAAGLQGNITHALQGGAAADEPPVGTGRRVGTRARQSVYYAYFPRFDTLPDGTRCVRVVRRSYPDPVSAAVAEDVQNVLWALTIDDYPPCPGAEVPVRTPATEAATFWRLRGEDVLPTPAPRIAPGYMLAGKLAYLETGATLATQFVHATPLGPLTIEATSRLFVDWGDGTGRTGPYTGPGGPWPDGTITHSWTTARPYDIAVVQEWTATWRLGEASGTLDGLTTEARIEDFPVRQLQAVRNV